MALEITATDLQKRQKDFLREGQKMLDKLRQDLTQSFRRYNPDADESILKIFVDVSMSSILSNMAREWDKFNGWEI